MNYAIVERRNHHAIHGLFDNLARAERHLAVVIPDHVARSYFMDKTLTAADFMISRSET